MIGELSRRLTTATFLPWRMRHLGGPWNTLAAAPLRRRWLRRRVAAESRGRADDVTVVIGAKNRADQRLTNTLACLRAQDHPADLVRIVVVDYDSEADSAARLRAICARFDAATLRVDGRAVWNRSHCMNVAIKQARSKFVLSTDADVLFGTSYLREALSLLRAEPLTVVYPRVLDLPAGSETDPSLARADGTAPDIEELMRRAQPRSRGNRHAGINATYTLFYRLIRGYDELLEVWGSEDNDLARRFAYLGLKAESMQDRSTCLHQWHPKHEGVRSPGYEKIIRRNESYFERTHSIYRNPSGWGEP
jgi:glycosyltransferase involved in cell wall biosynthesis